VLDCWPEMDMGPFSLDKSSQPVSCQTQPIPSKNAKKTSQPNRPKTRMCFDVYPTNEHLFAIQQKASQQDRYTSGFQDAQN